MLIEEYRAKFGKHGEIISKLSCKVKAILLQILSTIVNNRNAFKSKRIFANFMKIEDSLIFALNYLLRTYICQNTFYYSYAS